MAFVILLQLLSWYVGKIYTFFIFQFPKSASSAFYLGYLGIYFIFGLCICVCSHVYLKKIIISPSPKVDLTSQISSESIFLLKGI